MALLYDSRWRSIDSSGAPISGALLYVYNAGTTTLASIYTASDLVTPLANPVVADSSGRFPQIFTPLGQSYDAVEKTPGGVTIATYEDQEPQGTDSGAFAREFSGARLRITSGDIGDGTTGLLLETGDPSPDDIGGILRIGGYGSTQGDRLKIDFAEIETTGPMDVGGLITEDDKKLQGVVYAEGTFSGSASGVPIIALPNVPANVRGWRIEIIDALGSASSTISARLSFDSGVTYKSAAGNYWYATMASGGVTASSTTATDLPVGLVSGSSVRPSKFDITIIAPTSGLVETLWDVQALYYNTASTVFVTARGGGQTNGSFGRPDHVQFLSSSGTISFRYRLIPLRGFGE